MLEAMLGDGEDSVGEDEVLKSSPGLTPLVNRLMTLPLLGVSSVIGVLDEPALIVVLSRRDVGELATDSISEF